MKFTIYCTLGLYIIDNLIALLLPTKIDKGVANPNEQGQDTINTAIALLIEVAKSLLIIYVVLTADLL